MPEIDFYAAFIAQRMIGYIRLDRRIARLAHAAVRATLATRP